MKKWKVSRTASEGYAIAPVYLIQTMEVKADTRKIRPDETETEVQRFKKAVEKAQEELLKLASRNQIFEAHYALAGDIAILDGVADRIHSLSMNAEAALEAVCEEYVLLFASMEDEYMRERAADMKDVSRRILYEMKGIVEDPFSAMKEKSIVAARDLTPSDTAKMDLSLVKGIITEEGGVTSHVSIIAQNYGIPCLVGVGPFLDQLRNGEMAILDAQNGVFYAEPEDALVAEYKRKAEELYRQKEEMEQLSTLPSETCDGHHFRICANVGSLAEIRKALEYQIDGIGLFRTEFLYMEKDHFPTEEEQFEAYREAAQLLGGRELTIRTLDIGGDKDLDYFQFPKEENPFLGYRAIRFCLNQQAVFCTQLRAILRAAAWGNIRIMYPMLVSLDELRQANALLQTCREELLREGHQIPDKIPVGIMIETPAAVWLADDFAAYVDFFSIGTNDLTQYLLAADRGNPKISHLYDSFHPAVLRAVAHTIRAAGRHGIETGMCGELAGDERAAALLLGLGLDEFSVSAGRAAKIKYQLRNTSYEKMKAKAETIIRQNTVSQVMSLL